MLIALSQYMLKMKIKLLSVIIPLAFVGCAQTPDIVAMPYVAPPKNALATLVIYRANAMPTKVYARVNVDGALMATLPDTMYTWVQVPAGTHTVTAKFPLLAGVKEAEFSSVFESGKTYYLQYSGGAPNARIPMYGAGGVMIGSMDGGGSFWNKLSIVENDRAEQAIKVFGLQFAPATSSQQ
jgi:hypothetical protein